MSIHVISAHVVCKQTIAMQWLPKKNQLRIFKSSHDDAGTHPLVTYDNGPIQNEDGNGDSGATAVPRGQIIVYANPTLPRLVDDLVDSGMAEVVSRSEISPQYPDTITVMRMLVS